MRIDFTIGHFTLVIEIHHEPYAVECWASDSNDWCLHSDPRQWPNTNYKSSTHNLQMFSHELKFMKHIKKRPKITNYYLANGTMSNNPNFMHCLNGCFYRINQHRMQNRLYKSDTCIACSRAKSINTNRLIIDTWCLYFIMLMCDMDTCLSWYSRNFRADEFSTKKPIYFFSFNFANVNEFADKSNNVYMDRANILHNVHIDSICFGRPMGFVVTFKLSFELNLNIHTFEFRANCCFMQHQDQQF